MHILNKKIHYRTMYSYLSSKSWKQRYYTQDCHFRVCRNRWTHAKDNKHIIRFFQTNASRYLDILFRYCKVFPGTPTSVWIIDAWLLYVWYSVNTVNRHPRTKRMSKYCLNNRYITIRTIPSTNPSCVTYSWLCGKICVTWKSRSKLTGWCNSNRCIQDPH